MNKAYLVGFLDTREKPPKFLGAGIFSEPTPSSDNTHTFSFVIAKAQGASFHEAHQRLKQWLAGSGAYAWVLPYLMHNRS